MTGVLAPPLSTNLSSTLARDWALQVDTTDGGVTPAWIFVLGLHKIGPTLNPTLKDDSDLNSGGFKSQLMTATGFKLECEGNRKGVLATSVLTADPGQEYLRAKAYLVGYPNIAHIRWYRLDGLPDAYSGSAVVSWVDNAGTAEDLQGFKLTLDGRGELLSITKPTAP